MFPLLNFGSEGSKRHVRHNRTPEIEDEIHGLHLNVYISLGSTHYGSAKVRSADPFALCASLRQIGSLVTPVSSQR